MSNPKITIHIHGDMEKSWFRFYKAFLEYFEIQGNESWYTDEWLINRYNTLTMGELHEIRRLAQNTTIESDGEIDRTSTGN